MALKGSLERYRDQAANIAVLLVCAFVAINQYKKQLGVVSSLEVAGSEEEKRNARLSEIGVFKKQMDALAGFINGKDVTQALATFSALAKESGVNISSLRPLPAQEVPPYVRHRFDMTLEADSFHKLGEYVQKIENHRDIFSIEVLNIEPRDDNTLSVGLTLHTILVSKK